MTEAPHPRILIVDDSRMVRASIIKHLKGHYEIREEGDGEAAWQTLVLDHDIQAVISDLSMPVMDGFDLLARIRDSKVSRLRQLPVIMISGEEDEESRDKALALGANDFITKGIGTAELLARVDSLVRLGQAEHALHSHQDQQLRHPHSGLFTRAYLEAQAEQVLSLAGRQQAPASVLVLGFDSLERYTAQYGGALVDKLQERFAKLLAGNIRKEDSLGHYSDTTFAIVSPGTPGAASEAFANRLRHAVETSNIAVHGQRLPLTISIGIASFPLDGAPSATSLLAMAEARRAAAAAAGGNRAVAPAPAVEPAAVRGGAAVSVDQALAMLAAGQDEELRPQAAALAKALMPLLSFLNYELQYGPSADVPESKFQASGEPQGNRNPGGDAP
ncbi:MAG: response regulator [Betaproteobacteria bacterium]|nr:MAG: response regulator [Betaproteobacteria bacterium]